MTTDSLGLPLVLLISTARGADRRPDHLRGLPVRRPGGGALGLPRSAPRAASRRCATSSGGTAGRSSSPGGCCPPAGSRCCSPPVRWPTRGAGCCPASLLGCLPLGGRLRAARRRQRRHLRLPAAGHPARHVLVLLVGAGAQRGERAAPPAARPPRSRPEPRDPRPARRRDRRPRAAAGSCGPAGRSPASCSPGRSPPARSSRSTPGSPASPCASWWQPPVAALLLGLLAAGVWPLVLRIALPLAFFTLGLGGFLLLGAGCSRVFLAIPGVEVHSFATSVVVAVSMAAVSGLVNSVLAVNEDEVFFRRARRRAGNGAIREPCPPGVLFLQIDGLSYDTARRAVRDGSMPTLAAWLRSGSHVLTSWHTDWSSQTGASVSGDPARLQPRHPRVPLVREGPRPHRPGLPPQRRRRDRAPALRRPRAARRRRRRPRQPVHRRRPARQPHDELAVLRRPRPGPARSGAPATASAPATTPTSPTR